MIKKSRVAFQLFVLGVVTTTLGCSITETGFDCIQCAEQLCNLDRASGVFRGTIRSATKDSVVFGFDEYLTGDATVAAAGESRTMLGETNYKQGDAYVMYVSEGGVTTFPDRHEKSRCL